jgi:hypothetical protein
MLNSLTKLECPVCQTELSSFISSNSAVNFVKFQNPLFTPSRRHQWTFNWYQSIISLICLTAWRKDDVASLHHRAFGGGTPFR